MDFEIAWDTLMNRKNTTMLKELDEVLILENSLSAKEYYLTHLYQDSQYEFQALDSENCLCHIRILPLQSFDDVKVAYKNFSMLQEHADCLHLCPIKDIFEIYDEQWVFVIVCEYFESLSLGDISEYMDNLELPKEIGLMAYVRLIEIIQKSYETGIILNISPETVILIRHDYSDSYLYSTNLSFFNIKLLSSNQVLMYNKSKYENLFFAKRNTMDSELWGAALWIYLFFSGKKLDSLGNLKGVDDEEKAKILNTPDPAINSILLQSLKYVKDKSIFTNPTIKIWSMFLQGSWDQLDEYPVKDITPLLTILKFEISSSVLAASKKILMVASDYSNEVSKALGANDTLLDFIRIIRQYFDFHKYPLLINSVFLILKEKNFTTKMITNLISAGILYFFRKDLLDYARNDYVCKVCSEFMENNTLTVMQVLWDNGYIEELCKKQVKSEAEIAFLKVTISFYGQNSLTHIQKVSDVLDFNFLRQLQQFYEIPIVFKWNRPHQLFSYINFLLHRGLKLKDDSYLEIIKTLIFLLNEAFLLPSFLHKQHLEGRCSNDSANKFLEFFGKNPLIVKCNQCKYNCCVMCAEQFHKYHDLTFIINSVFRCFEIQKIESFNTALIKLPVYEQKFDMLEVGGEWVGQSFFSTKKLNEKSEFAGYFEVTIVKAGICEDFYCGIWGTGVVYFGNSGEIRRNGHLVGLGPRIGSYDTIGAGIINGKVYFTYNGLLIRPLFDCYSHIEPRIYYGYSDDGIQVELKSQGWLFSSQETIHLSKSQECDDILHFILKKLQKLFKKPDPKLEDLRTKFLELVYGLKKVEVYEKALKLIGRY